jgi:hypothetical protein
MFPLLINENSSMASASSDFKSCEGSLDSLLDDPLHDCYYFVDTNIIIAYHNHQLPVLNRYIDVLASKGPRFFVTDRIAGEFSAVPLPQVFHRFHHSDAVIRADQAYPQVVREFELPSCNSKFKTDLRWLLESGFCIHACDDIPVKEILRGRAFALTMNAKLIHRFLRSRDMRLKFERIVDENALEHLADLRLLDSVGAYSDLSAF